MNILLSLFLSILLHLCILFFNNNPNDTPIQIYLDRGTTVSFRLPKSESQIATNKNESVGKENTQSSESELIGVKSKDVSDFKNSIQYPPDALQQGLESNCEWKVLVGLNGSAEKIELVRPCKYKIFEAEFMKVVKHWKFKSPENTWLDIPILFRIEMENE
jgi:TonB family protein